MATPILRLRPLLLLASLGCASINVTTTVLPPHRLESPICPSAVVVADDSVDIPTSGRILARLRVEGGDFTTTGSKVRRRLQEEAAKLGANHVLASEITTSGTLAALGMTAATTVAPGPRTDGQAQALAHPNQNPQAAIPIPTDPSFYGRGVAYAIFVPEDTLRTQLECPKSRP